jgi:hypothetical protein
MMWYSPTLVLTLAILGLQLLFSEETSGGKYHPGVDSLLAPNPAVCTPCAALLQATTLPTDQEP